MGGINFFARLCDWATYLRVLSLITLAKQILRHSIPPSLRNEYENAISLFGVSLC